jgi:hypothetical protein
VTPTKYLSFPATDVNEALDDDEADPEYNILADEEEETGENFCSFCGAMLSDHKNQ